MLIGSEELCQANFLLTQYIVTNEGGVMEANLSNEINKLTIPERILLVEEIWDGIARESETFVLSQSQKEELEMRSFSFEKNPAQGRSWEQIKSDYLTSK